ncbi:TetR/AcrR family transcriptional regulator [Clostridium grantii]|uniref:Transcriptional regulator, TetR family n=1 Tax=Clostridium grantii DSM 8605 TaxID=1121316 RepID=A0A1M5T710_9CLOT|nr:TetR/AcrR family transcriptional regulator [Clostridium grantii]SHH46468.1 transcriptional regulator, TetR family [Clostridium grantii DSM 8605]
MAVDGKERIVQATKKVIARSGITGATMRAIAQEAGLSTGAIYHYYKSKEEILYEIMDTSLSETVRVEEERRINNYTTEHLIDIIAERIGDRFRKKEENTLQFHLSKEGILGDEAIKAKFHKKYEEWIRNTEDLLGVLYSKKSPKQMKAVCSLLIGAIDGVVMQLLLESNQAEIEDITEVYKELLKVGIPNFLDHLNELEKDSK